VGYLALDVVGDRAPASPRTHVAAVAAHVVIEIGWCAGVVAGLVTRPRSGDVEHPLQRDPGELSRVVVDHDAIDELAAHQ